MNKKILITVIIGLLLVALSSYVGYKFVGPLFVHEEQEEQPNIVTDLPDVNQDGEDIMPKEDEVKEYVPVVFIGKNNNGEEVYKVVKREYDESIDGTKLRFAVSSLILGPKQKEKQNGIYSEVPINTQILHVYDKGNYLVVDLSSGFVYDGGTESVYKRLFQLIKTINKNTDKPTYLYIDGKQADVIGGDGIMITQPLSENSIGE